jgi:transcriptional regulator with XRE-family HTH domain
MTIGSWERGDRVPTPDALWRLAQMYGVRIEEFYPPQGDVPQTRDLRPVLARVLALVGDALNGDGAGEGS